MLGTISHQARAQKQEIKTIFSQPAKVTGFGALEAKYSKVNEQYGTLLGVNGGVIINRHFTLGLAAYGLSSSNKVESNNPNQDQFLYSGYGGLLLGYNIFPKEIIHFNFPLLLGYGRFEVTDRDYFNDFVRNEEFNLDDRIEHSNALVIEPGVEMEINVAKFFRIGLGTSYRMVHGSTLSLTQITDDNLSNWSTQVSLKFGKF
jgi:hypothetical protein